MEARPDISYGNVRGLVNVVLGVYCEKMIHVMFLDINVLHYSDVTQYTYLLLLDFLDQNLIF